MNIVMGVCTWWLRVLVVGATLTAGCAAARGAGTVLPKRPASTEYVVKKGDTMYSIARRHGLTVAEVLAINNLPNHHLAVGARLRLAPKTNGNAKATPARVSRRPAALASRLASPPPPPRRMLRWPLRGVITSSFGTRGSRAHDGIDIGAPRGSQVRAAADGEVVFSNRHGNYGNLVIVRHLDGIMTIYAHHDTNLVRLGQKVRSGEVIARVGTTGRATGPHLHFEVRQGTRPQNPLAYLPPP